MAAIIAQLAAANRKRKARRKATLPPDKSNRTLPPFDPCFDPNKHNPYLRLKALVDHRNEINRTAREICDQLQKDDEEWCYFMRYGKPRRNRAIPDLSKPIIPEDNATLERRKRKQKWWQWLNATLSCVCLALFLTILLILFIIFSNVDHQEDSTSSHPIDVFHSNNQSTTSFDSSNTSKPVTPPP